MRVEEITHAHIAEKHFQQEDIKKCMKILFTWELKDTNAIYVVMHMANLMN